MSGQSFKEQMKAVGTIALGLVILCGSIVFVSGGFVYGAMAFDEAKAGRACYSAWDEAFHPRFQDGRCSILQLGLRVPAPYAGDYVKPPQARD